MSQPPLRVLHVAAGNLFGGIERMLLTIVSARQGDGVHEVAVSFDGRLARELRAAGSAPHVLGAARFRRPDSVWRARRVLSRRLAAARPDAVICHAPWSAALAGPVVRRAGLPLLMYAHDAPDPHGWPERRLARLPPDRCVCNSQHTAAAIARWLPDVPRDVVHPPVAAAIAITAEERRALRAGLGAGDGTTVILMASRLEEWKGQRVLLAAAERLRGDATVWIAGGAQRPAEALYLDELVRLAARSAIDVRFLGERNDVPSLMAAADVYCQPNTTPEPFGIAFVEALAAGVPVVTTAFGGALEIVDDTCGVLVDTASAAPFAAALQELIDSPARRASLAAAAPSRAHRVSDPIARLSDLHRVVRADLARTSAA
ncbi:MAG TPA: glycosyltransferase [Vicinamibacterales bacterium]|nr:glycosyltransferase [Vicinamibacterales bacterium]